MATLADLEALIGPPSAVPPTVDWRELERMSGLCFPSDYKALCGRYGILEIDAFMAVDYAGIPANIEVKLAECRRGIDLLRVRTDKYGFIYLADDSGNEVEAEPYPYYPEPDGVFPWGRRRTATRCFGSPTLIQSDGRSLSPTVVAGGILPAA
jgi:hypothetical protein